MPKKIVLSVALLTLGALASSPLTALWFPGQLPLVERPQHVPGELIVTFEPGVSASARDAALDEGGVVLQRHLRTRVATSLVRVPAGADLERRAAALRALPEVRFVDRNFRRYIDAIPNDARFDELWGMHNTGQTGGIADADIDAVEAWDITTGSSDVVVAVLDSGMELGHPDLNANLYVNPNEIPDNGIDDDGNGYVDDVNGWDFRDNDNHPGPTGGLCLGHGTHTAGTVGAVGNNGTGVAGVAHDVQLMPLRAFYIFLLIFCTADDADLLEAIDYMGIMGVPVSNNSWGGAGFSFAMYDAIARARHLFVASAGNSNNNNDTNPSYPASYNLDNVVSVASTTDRDQRSSFSNFGATTVDLGAPGSSILSTVPGGYRYLDGTSMAGPHVAGAAALLLADDPTATPLELKDRLLRGTDFIGIEVLTQGRLNANESLSLLPSEVVVDVEPTGGTEVPPGGTIDYELTVRNDGAVSHTVDVSVRLWASNGKEVTVAGPVSLTLGAGESRSISLSQEVPGGVPLGTYWLIGQATDSVDQFDEDVVFYEIG